MRLAIVNWRDPWHPEAGGAERYAWELARRLAARGSQVTYVTGRAPGQLRRERIEGVEFARMGGRFTIYPLVLVWFLLRRRRFQAVIDCQNGIPFFTPWVLPRRIPVFCTIFHVHDRQFELYFPGWLAWVGRTMEGPLACWTYRRHACSAISPTTRTALRERLNWTGPVYLVPVGVDLPEIEAVPTDDLVCVSRLVPHKRLHLLLDLAEQLEPGRTLHLVGRGPEAEPLRAEIERRGLTGVVRLRGFLPEEEKLALLAGAALHLSTSHGEGWGLCVAEAAALGVPTVAFDVDGLRDAVRDGTTGWLVPAGGSLAETVRLALKELDGRRPEISVACRRWASAFAWDRTAERMESLLATAIRNGSARRAGEPGIVIPGYGDGSEGTWS